VRVEVSRPTTGWLLVRVVGDAGVGVEDIGVRLAGRSTRAQWRRTDSGGMVEFSDLKAGRLVVSTDRGRSQWATIVAGERAVTEIRLDGHRRVEGIVVNQGGQPVENASVWLAESFASNGAGRIVATTGPGGRFTIEHVLVPCLLSASATGAAWGSGRLVGPDESVALRLGGAGAAVSARILTANGTPAVHARVEVGRHAPSTVLSLPPVQERWTDQNGVVLCEGLLAGVAHPIWIDHEGVAHGAVLEGGRDQRIIELREPCEVTWVYHARGAREGAVDLSWIPLAGRGSRMAYCGPRWALGELRLESSRTETVRLAPGAYRVSAKDAATGSQIEERELFFDSGAVRIDVASWSGPSLDDVVVLVDESGQALSRWEVRGTSGEWSATTNERGEVGLPVDTGAPAFDARPPGSQSWWSCTRSDSDVLVVRGVTGWLGTATGVLAPWRPMLLHRMTVQYSTNGEVRHAGVFLRPDGRWETDLLPFGTYPARGDNGAHVCDLGSIVVSQDSTAVQRLVVPEFGKVRFVPGDHAAPDLTVTVSGSESAGGHSSRCPTGRWLDLPVGEYTATAHGSGIHIAWRQFRVAPESPTEVEFVLVPGPDTEFVFEAAEDLDEVVWRTSDGVRIWRMSGDDVARTGRVTLGLPQGDYRVDWQGDAGERGAAGFRVPATDGAVRVNRRE
jgi:hypothetical protein